MVWQNLIKLVFLMGGKMESLLGIIINLIEQIGMKNIIIYFLIINIVGFLTMCIDKYKAKKGYWRTPEKTIFSITLLGGGIGTVTGMFLFRHKTKKMNFTIGLPTILVAEIAFIIYLIIMINK